MQTELTITITNTSQEPMACWVILDEMLSKLQRIANREHPDELILEDGKTIGVGQLTIEDLPLRFYHSEFDEPNTTGLLSFTTNPPTTPNFSNGDKVRISFSAEATFAIEDSAMLDYRTWEIKQSRWSSIIQQRLYTLNPISILSEGIDIGEIAECDLISEHQWNEYVRMATDLDYEWSHVHRRFRKRHLKATHYDIQAMWVNKIANIETPF